MNTPLAFIATCDLVAQVRGRSLAAKNLINENRNVGWVPADLAMTALGAIADPEPFGSFGDLRLAPIKESKVSFQSKNGNGNDLDFYLAHQVNPDGSIWECDPRQPMVDALAKLQSEFGIELIASFEHEFHLSGESLKPGIPFGFDSFRNAAEFGEDLISQLSEMDLNMENWLPEYGVGQFEITLKPAPAAIAADRAIILRELVRDFAKQHEYRATFAPLMSSASVGNGVHVHLSFKVNGKPASYDPTKPGNLSDLMAKACAGILAHADSILAWSAPSQVSFLRLTPHRWSAGVKEIAIQNREALLRICPINTLGGNDPKNSFNVEFRAADATANPWLVIAVLANAMLEGLRNGVLPDRILDGDFSERTDLNLLPKSLDEALSAFKADSKAMKWFSPKLVETHLAIRSAESRELNGLTDDEKCIRYVNAY